MNKTVKNNNTEMKRKGKENKREEKTSFPIVLK